MYLQRAVAVNQRPRDPVETRQIRVRRVCDPAHFKPCVWHVLNLWCPNHIFEMSEARVMKFCIQVG